MVGLKSIQTIVGIITDEVHPYISLSSNRVPMKMHRDASHLLLSQLQVYLFVYFLALSSLLTSSIYLVGFYTCVHFLSSVAVWFKTQGTLGYACKCTDIVLCPCRAQD